MAFELAELSLDEEGVLRIFGHAADGRGPELAVGGSAVSLAEGALISPDGTFEAYRAGFAGRRGGEWRLDGRPVTPSGRIGETSAARIADRTATRAADPKMARTLGGALVVTTRDPLGPYPAFLPAADAAAGLDAAGHAVALLHVGAATSFARSVRVLLTLAGTLHHLDAATPEDEPDTPWQLPAPDARLKEAVARLVREMRPDLVVAADPGALALVRPLAGSRRLFLLDRAGLDAPRLIAAPVARRKLETLVRAGLAGIPVLVPSRDLAHAAEALLPGHAVEVLPPGAGLAPAPASHGETVLAVGEAAAAALDGLAGEARVTRLSAETSFLRAHRLLREARALVIGSDAGPEGQALRAAARAAGLPVASDLSADAADLPLTGGPLDEPAAARLREAARRVLGAGALRPSAPRPIRPPSLFAGGAEAGDERWSAGYATFVARALAATLAARAGHDPVGVLLPGAVRPGDPVATACARIVGAEAVFGLPGSGLERAPLSGVRTVVVAEPDRARCRALMEDAAGLGLEPLPLLPQARPAELRRLAGLAGTGAGLVARIGEDGERHGADLLLLVGGRDAPADAVELTGPDDARRGRLATLAPATDARFAGRPTDVTGYDRLVTGEEETGDGLPAGVSVTHPFDAMLALAAHLDCARVLIDAARAHDRPLAGSLARFGFTGGRVAFAGR
ncbi:MULTISPECIES: hypothetical protein [Methylobacterium]|uniref:Uncharacterized protein n=2 Tax=Pseudomonadota TaxID=1224 RepID=A0ABQ4SWG5_9HYPH|nr:MULTISPECIES: hypothetical protein [Methylobacterium]PIU06277.1 MAG: hypothetical protein COT56_10690 [Methylobacterium sp. CG09_land_8_20_14_0_10_71_15]PIU11172.1 MAG: hypothetical protein COT28_21405 [Methylobacterium sp. CG08_land_8_20_14_0_20_71_15]GBU19559.1 hypothetical protein AwMethylo_37740 [Methylobacterium sp.]GJE07545.1 hypothetical protein AOPFMNJM_2874 [Methylobacterium jeotgali]